MATPILPPDFKEFLQLLNTKKVEYLLIGGYAVGYYGYVRATADMDIWIALSTDNIDSVIEVLQEFGFNLPDLSPELFMKPGAILRMGVPPFRIEMLTNISGVSFAECYTERVLDTIKDTKGRSGRPLRQNRAIGQGSSRSS